MVKMEGESEMFKRMIERFTFPSLIKKQSKKKFNLVMGAAFQKQEMKQMGEEKRTMEIEQGTWIITFNLHAFLV